VFEDLADWLKILPSCGYAVRIKGRGRNPWVYYEERHRSAEVFLELGVSGYLILASTLSNWDTREGEISMTVTEQEMVLQRISTAVSARLGGQTVIDRGKTNVPIFFPVTFTRALPPFVLLNDHSVSHSHGFTVSFVNRRLLKYVAGCLTAYIEFELTHDGEFEVQAKELRVGSPGQAEPPQADRDKIRARIMQALAAMQLKATLI